MGLWHRAMCTSIYLYIYLYILSSRHINYLDLNICSLNRVFAYAGAVDCHMYDKSKKSKKITSQLV